MDREKAYAEWLLTNQDKKGTPEWETVATAYKGLRQPSPSLEGEASRAFGFRDYGEGRANILPLARIDKSKGGLESGQGMFGTNVRPAVPGVLKNVMTSALLPGFVARGGQPSARESLDFAANFAVPGSPAAVRGAMRGTKRDLMNAAPAQEQLAAKAKSAYGAAEGMGIKVKQDSFLDFVSNAEPVIMNRVGRNPERARSLHPDTVAVFDRVVNDLERGDLDLNDLALMRRDIQNATLSIDPQKASDRDVAGDFLEMFDDFVENLKDSDFSASNAQDPASLGFTLKTARQAYRRSKKMQDIDAMVTNARSYQSGFENGIRLQFKNLLRNPKRLRGWSPDEIAQMRAIQEGTTLSNTLKFLGKFAPSDRGTNILGTTIGVAGGNAVLGPIAGPATALIGSRSAQLGASKATMDNVEYLRALAATGGNAPKSPMRTRKLLGPAVGSGAVRPPDNDRERLRQWLSEDPENRV